MRVATNKGATVREQAARSKGLWCQQRCREAASGLQQRDEGGESGAVVLDIKAERHVEAHGESEHHDYKDYREEEDVGRRGVQGLEDEIHLPGVVYLVNTLSN